MKFGKKLNLNMKKRKQNNNQLNIRIYNLITKQVPLLRISKNIGEILINNQSYHTYSANNHGIIKAVSRHMQAYE